MTSPTLSFEEQRREINEFDREYHRVIDEILARGVLCDDRTGTGTIDLTGTLMRFDLGSGKVPVLTTKYTAWKTTLKELLWLISGDTSVAPLIRQGVKIWSEWPTKNWLRRTQQTIPPQEDKVAWATVTRQFEREIIDTPGFAEEFGNMGPIYGHQWRKWPGPDGKPIDQLANAIHRIRTKPDCRRIIVEAWNVGYLDEMAVAGLPPCHKSFQFRVRNGKLDLMINQRSCDMFLGVPLNVLSYSVLLCMIAQLTGLGRGHMVWVGGSSHVYNNHMEQMQLQLSRTSFPAPYLDIRPGVPDIDSFKFEDFTLRDYQHHPAIKAPIAV